MKKQINPTIKAHLIRGAFYLLLLLAICAIPFALARPGIRGTAKPNTAAHPGVAGLQLTSAKAVHPGAPATRVSVPKTPKAHVGLRPFGIGKVPLFTYVIDDGTAEDSVGLTNGGNLLCLNSFPVSGGNNLITSISIAWGTPAFPDPSLNGLPYTAYLWSDPNGDGSPTDGVVLASAPGVVAREGTDTFLTTNLPPTMVNTANFFVGFVITHAPGQFPAAFDETPPTLPNRSWVSIGGNPNNMSDAVPIESVGLVGNWLIRAEGQGGGPTPTPTPTPTCAPGSSYTTATGTGVITPGGTDIGNHCDDCFTQINLPFPVNVYGTPTSVAYPASNGDLHLANPGLKSFYYAQCVPVDPNPPDVPFVNTLFPNYDDLRTD